MVVFQPFLFALAITSSLAQTFASTTTFDFASNSFPTGLVKSEWPVEDKPYSRLFVSENVRVQNGFMELVVPGGQTQDPILCAEVATKFRVRSASVRTHAILTDEHGVVNGRSTLLFSNSLTDSRSRNVPLPQCQPRNGH